MMYYYVVVSYRIYDIICSTGQIENGNMFMVAIIVLDIISIFEVIMDACSNNFNSHIIVQFVYLLL